MPTWDTSVSATASSVCAGTVVHRSPAALKRFLLTQVEAGVIRPAPAGDRGQPVIAVFTTVDEPPPTCTGSADAPRKRGVGRSRPSTRATSLAGSKASCLDLCRGEAGQPSPTWPDAWPKRGSGTGAAGVGGG